jgi:hypothetical protein
VNENPLRRTWARASACLVVSPIAFLTGGVLIFGAIGESFRRDPRGWVVIGLTSLGVALFALGATTWARALRLIGQRMRAGRNPVS